MLVLFCICYNIYICKTSHNLLIPKLTSSTSSTILYSIQDYPCKCNPLCPYVLNNLKR